MSKLHGRENEKVNGKAREAALGHTVEVVDKTPKNEIALREESIQHFWEENDIFNKSVEKPAGAEPKGDYVFYDGPPFATGLPHYGHILASTLKDAVPRFWTMNGYRVRRKWGWDCHGLPLENLIEKKLGLATKRDIEEYGIKNFNEAARGTVMEYAEDWKQIIPRMGRFADMENDYKTMDSTYTESVWWVFKSLHDKGLVYEGFKSMHLCPRCGTTLSNFEVNQGYKDIKDIAVFVELPFSEPLLEEGEPMTSLIVWTTTPWTLPGNLAAAVHNDYDYVVIEKKDEGVGELVRFVVAKERLEAIFGENEYTIVKTLKGKDLVGKSYEPPFPYLKDQNIEGAENAWKIYHADYVELGEEGTGAVHLAPAYGEEDMVLAQEHGVPIFHHVDEAGHFKDFVTDFAGQLVKPKDDDESGIDHKDADIEILKALQASGRIFKKENITHSYPHCWRCDTPLLNYATTSWFVEVNKIKNQMVEANNKVHWVPEHVGKNRFGKWLEGARDWAVSRQRYWGAPLPIWRNPKTEEIKVFGSLEEMQQNTPKRNNHYIVMRHGESESNIKGIISCNKENKDGLTELGQEQVRASVSKLPEKIDIIYHSGFERTRETAELVAEHYPDAVLIEDDRIREFDLSDEYEGGEWGAYNGQFKNWTDRYRVKVPGNENRRDLQVRMGQFLYDVDEVHDGKSVLIVSHAGPIFGLQSAVRGWTPEDAEVYHDQVDVIYFDNAEIWQFEFTPIPHNDNFELDFHRPYIDDFELIDKDGTRLVRVPDVFDCWFESGSMPYGQHHYPFSCDEEKFLGEYYPAQFIAESVDQTRGWFYSTMVLGVALFGKSPYENVVTNGLVLAEDGRKMSKSLQNYPDPMELVARQGADSMRFYLLSSSIIKGEDLNFSEKEVQELQRKNIGRLHNVLAMYEMFANETEARADSDNVLDRWIIARLNQVIIEITLGYKNYELDKATRPIIDFIEDLSVWYLRRSRDRLKGEDVEDKTKALATLRYTLRTLALVMAPSMPFYAEHLYRAVREESEPESVHLTAWPEIGEVDDKVIEYMEITREIVTAALDERTKANIKVRQPLQKVTTNTEVGVEYQELVKEEVNVKAVETNTNQAVMAELDTNLTPKLVSEGVVRELMRLMQDERKKQGLEPADRVVLTVDTNEAGEGLVAEFREMIEQTVGASDIRFEHVDAGADLTTSDHTFKLSIKKMS